MTHATAERRQPADAGLPAYSPSPPPPQTRAPKTSAGPRNHDSLNIRVINGDVEGALRLLKKRAHGMLREIRDREAYRKPGDRKRQKRLRAIRRRKAKAARARRHERG